MGIQTRHATVHIAQDSIPATVAVQNGDTPFDSAMMQQSNTVFSRPIEGLTLKLYTDGDAVPFELRHYLEAPTALSDRLMLSEKGAPGPLASRGADAALSYVRIFREGGSCVGLCFHGVPGGRELTPSVLGLYSAGSRGQPVAEEALPRIAAIDRDI